VVRKSINKTSFDKGLRLCQHPFHLRKSAASADNEFWLEPSENLLI
jgi:hypothetical protein